MKTIKAFKEYPDEATVHIVSRKSDNADDGGNYLFDWMLDKEFHPLLDPHHKLNEEYFAQCENSLEKSVSNIQKLDFTIK